MLNNTVIGTASIRPGLGASERSEGERSEPERSAEALNPGGHFVPAAKPGVAAPPDPEVPAKPLRRRFTAQYKQDILQEADTCTYPGSMGALLRREGLFSSHLTAWRRQRQQALNQALTPRKRGRKPGLNPLTAENRSLRQENARLQHRLQQAELIVEIQKKASELLAIPLSHLHNGGND